MRAEGAEFVMPLPEPARSRWIDVVLGMVDSETRDGVGHRASHYVFAKRVLRSREAGPLALHYGGVPLTREAMDGLVQDWIEEVTAAPSSSGGDTA